MSFPLQLFGQPAGGHKPWLARREWRERRIVWYAGPRDFYFGVALAGFGLPAAFLAAVGIRRIADGDPDGPAFVLGGALCGAIFALIPRMWIRWRRFGKSICHLETLPGVIGGWFKASVEVTLPVETLPSVLVALVNLEMRGVMSITRWERSYRLSPARFTHLGGDRYLIPVRFRIPRAEGRYAEWNWLWGGGWLLRVTAALPGTQVSAIFCVPVFETDEAPPEEQRPEEELA